MASKGALCGVGCALVLMALGVSGCANAYDAPLRPPSGFIYTSTTLPLDLEAKSRDLAGMTKLSSESFYLLWPYPSIDVAWGDDAALGKAARDQQFGPLHYAEVEVTTVIGLFGRYTVTIYGPSAH